MLSTLFEEILAVWLIRRIRGLAIPPVFETLGGTTLSQGPRA